MHTSNSKLKVLFVLENLQGGGAERSTLNLLRYLDRERFEPTLFLLEKYGVYFSDVPKDVRLVYACKSFKYNKYLMPFYFMKLLFEAMKCDLIIGALEFRATYLAYAVGTILRKPVVGWVHVDIAQWLKEWRRWHSIAVKFVYPRLAYVVCVSQEVEQSVLKVAPVKSERLVALYNPNDVNSVIEKSKESLPEWSVDIVKSPFLIALGRMSYQKGFDLLIMAHKKLLEKGVGHKLLILGDGALRGQLEELVRSLGLEHSVFMPGYIRNPYPLVKRANAFVLSSRYEGLPTVVIEALVLGTPVVSTDCSGSAEILSDGRYGVLVPPEDSDSLCSGMSKILSDCSLREKLSKSGVERARWFSPENRVPPWEQLLMEVA